MTSPDDPLMRPVLGAASGGRGGGACPDAEVLGLYAERALGGEEHASVESHVARCGRCQEALAAFVRSAPEPHGAEFPSGVLAWWQGWRWVVPLAATAGVAVLAVWIGRAPSEQATDLARGAAVRETDALQAPSAAPTAPATGAASGASDLKKAPGAPPQQAAERPRVNAGQTTSALEKGKATAGTMAAPLAQNASGARADTAPAETRQALRDVGADKAVGRLAEVAPAATAPAAPAAIPRVSAAAPPPPAPSAAPESLRETVAVTTPAAARSAPAPAAADAAFRAAAAASGAPTAAAESTDARLRAAEGGRAQQEPARKAAEATAQAKSEVAGAASRDARDGPTPWRLQAGVVERSTDGGRTWTRVRLPVKDAVRTLVVIDATTATVTTARGATFRTADGGVTWRRVRP